MSETNATNDLVLAVDVPANAAPGSTFHVALENRFFEVTVPEGVSAGQTINIIVPQTGEAAKNATEFQTVEAVRDAALEQVKRVDETFKITEKVKQIDEHYKITERAQAVSAQALAKAQEYDAKYDITNRVNNIITAGVNKAREFDTAHKITTKAVVIGEMIIAYAREIDAKFAISATSARVVVAGANAVLSAYYKALAINDQHKITERALNVSNAVTTTVKKTLETVNNAAVATGLAKPPAAAITETATTATAPAEH